MHSRGFNKRIKEAFSHVKSDITHIRAKIVQIEGKISDLSFKLENALKTASKQSEFPQEASSIGNEGVYSRTHSLFTHTLTPLDKGIKSHFLAGFDVEKLFHTLTNKEFLVFLTIFQVERTTYEQIAMKLSLTSGCVRSYVSSLLKKGAPLIKRKLKNRKVILSTNNDFKILTSEQKLTNLYYSTLDPDQTTLI